MEKMLKGIETVLYVGEYINDKIGRENTIKKMKNGSPKVATISVNLSKVFFNFTLSSCMRENAGNKTGLILDKIVFGNSARFRARKYKPNVPIESTLPITKLSAW